MKKTSYAAHAAAVTLDPETETALPVNGLKPATHQTLSKRNLKLAWAHDQGIQLALKPAARVLLAYIADHADFASGKVLLGHKEITPATGLDSRQIRAMTALLVQKRLLQPPRRNPGVKGNSAMTYVPAANTVWGLQDAMPKADPLPGAGQIGLTVLPEPTVTARQSNMILGLGKRAGQTWQQTIAWLREEHQVDIADLAPNEIPKRLDEAVIAPLKKLVQQAEAKGCQTPGKTAEDSSCPWPEATEFPEPPTRTEPREPAAVALWKEIKKQLKTDLPNHVYALQIKGTTGAALNPEELWVEVKDAENAAIMSTPSFQRELQKQIDGRPDGPQSIKFLRPPPRGDE